MTSFVADDAVVEIGHTIDLTCFVPNGHSIGQKYAFHKKDFVIKTVHQMFSLKN